MATVITIQATITIAQANRPPVIDEQPPLTTTLVTGTPTVVAFGKVSDPDNDPLTVRLEPAIPGCSVTLEGNQISLNWDGTGVPGVHTAAVIVDDGKA